MIKIGIVDTEFRSNNQNWLNREIKAFQILKKFVVSLTANKSFWFCEFQKLGEVLNIICGDTASDRDIHHVYFIRILKWLHQ